MVIYYTRSNGVDDSVMNIHLDNFVQSLPQEIRTTLTLTKHERGTTYNPQLVERADLVIVGLRDDEDEVIGKGVYEECIRALQLGRQVLVVRKEDNDNGQIFLQEIREQDLDTLDDGIDWKKYAYISLYNYAMRSRMPTEVDQHDLDEGILLNFMLGNNEETKEYMRLRFPDFVGSSASTTDSDIQSVFDLLSLPRTPTPQSTNESSNLPLDWPEPNVANTPKTPIYGYRHGDTILVTLPKCIGKTFNFTVSVDWLSPQEDTNMHEFISGIGLTQSSIGYFINEVLGKADNWSITHLWEEWNFGEATKVINALERRIKFAGGTFFTVVKNPETEAVQATQVIQQSDADAFFDLVEKQPQQQESRFISNEDYISLLDNNDDLLLLL
jgi:hypothetical protein